MGSDNRRIYAVEFSARRLKNRIARPAKSALGLRIGHSDQDADFIGAEFPLPGQFAPRQSRRTAPFPIFVQNFELSQLGTSIAFTTIVTDTPVPAQRKFPAHANKYSRQNQSAH